MKTKNDIKQVVKDKYGEIAVKSGGCCCGCSGDDKIAGFNIMMDDYSGQKGHVPDADLGLGCGLPTEFADIREGDIVVDLGSGAGNDIFIAREIAGEKGHLIGIDFTKEMIDKANRNNDKLGFKNVEFRLGDIEKLPVESEIADVVISNCVLNLVPDKIKAFSEIYRILKHNGHFCVSDIVIEGDLPEKLQRSAEMYAGCIAGAVQKNEYLRIIEAVGFSHPVINKTKIIDLPDSILEEYLNSKEIVEFRSGNTGIFSITVTASK
ncbi:MAG: arsenite methyltransferase [Ignavibacteriales bacterium]|nr:arsenite methyltransferase [Ignavibacteriales bacterium]MCF8314963.1 arsenite methyltransferase [Ignavibacteriales bacterium]MCF8436088.1 arsenite methyltransferase [Ignavibacteriales bacterium]